MLKIYQGTTSVCTHKVRLVMEEKGLAYDGPILNLQRGDQHDPEYLKLNPNGVIPTLIHDGNVIIESSVIMAYLEDVFPEPSLVPPDPLDRVRMRLWMKAVDEYLHPAVNVLTFATANRKSLLARTEAEREAYFERIDDAAKRARLRQVVANGLAADVVIDAIRTYDKRLAAMEDALAAGPYLAGEAYSLADAALTPYLNRLDLLGLSALWADRPKLANWLVSVRSRPSFDGAISRFFTDADAERFAPDGQDVAARLREALAA